MGMAGGEASVPDVVYGCVVKPEVRLLVVCGLPGSGKTTLAKRLGGERDAARLSPDDWMGSAGIDLWDAEVRASIEVFQRSLAETVLRKGRSVVIEWGTWARSERDALRLDAERIGVPAELHFLDVPIEILWERIERRHLEMRHGSRAPTPEDLESWVAAFEPPTEEEYALFARPLAISELDIMPEVMVRALHHVQLAMPAGGEAQAEDFYGGILGLTRVAKPPHLEVRGGCWFEDEGVRVHLGVEADFRPARKAHPAFMVEDLDALGTAFQEAGVDVVTDEPLAGFKRFYVSDPFGNRLEFLQPLVWA